MRRAASSLSGRSTSSTTGVRAVGSAAFRAPFATVAPVAHPGAHGEVFHVVETPEVPVTEHSDQLSRSRIAWLRKRGSSWVSTRSSSKSRYSSGGNAAVSNRSGEAVFLGCGVVQPSELRDSSSVCVSWSKDSDFPVRSVAAAAAAPGAASATFWQVFCPFGIRCSAADHADAARRSGCRTLCFI